jgi:hypothetical protein
LRQIYETTLATHCAPVLLEKKPAALFAKPVWWDETRKGVPEIDDIKFLTLSRLGRNLLIFVYRHRLLAGSLGCGNVRAALGGLGYPAPDDIEGCLSFLGGRFLRHTDFPHEVGFFLGYPFEDVMGFIADRGAHCKACGMWKVYSDVERARELFDEYEKCKLTLLDHIRKGGTILGGGLALIAC